MLSTEDYTRAAPEVRSGLHDLVKILLKSKLVIGASIAASIALAVLFLFLVQPVYQASALVQVQPQAKSVGQALTDQISHLTGGEAVATAEIQLITSRLVIGKVFDDLRLDVDISPQYFPVVGKAVARARRGTGHGLLPPVLGLSGFAWGGESMTLGAFEVPREYLTQSLAVVLGDAGGFALFDPDGTQILSGQVGAKAEGVSPAGPVSILIAEAEGRAGQTFSLTPNGRAEAIAGFLRKLSVAQQGVDSGVIQVALKGADPERITAVINQIVQQYAAQNVTWRSSEASQTLGYLNVQLPAFKAKMEVAQSAMSAFKKANTSADLNSETQLLLQQSDTNEIALSHLVETRAQTLEKYRANHPVIIAIDSQIAKAREQKAGILSRISALPAAQKDQLRLQTDVDVSTQLYTSMLNSIQQLQVARAGTVGDVRIVDEAVEPVLPIFPNRKVLAIAAPIIGLIIGCFAAVLLASLRHRIEDPAELEAVSGLHVLSQIPYSKRQRHGGGTTNGRQKIIVVDDPDDIASEGIRSLRTGLTLTVPNQEWQTMIITGPSPEVGKSFTSVNLAASYARGGKSVVLVDGDLRRPSLNRYFGPSGAGLQDWLTGSANLDAIVQQHAGIAGLHFVAAGSRGSSPAELLSLDGLQKLITELKAKFDYILIDTPPVLSVSDALVIGRLADHALLVFQEGRHTEQESRDAVNALKRAGIQIAGAAMNKVGRAARYQYLAAY